MNAEHDAWRDLVLVLEELEGDEREKAEAHLASCPECRSLLVRLQGVERGARLQSVLARLERGEPVRMSAGDAEQAHASLLALRVRLGLEGAAPAAGRARAATAGTGARPWRRHWVRVLVPAAAVAAALLVLWPRPSGDHVLVRDLRLLPASQMRGGGEGGWHTGDAFVLRFELAAPAQPVVFHAGPSGELALLYPEDPGAALEKSPAGPVTLPPEAGGIEWRFEGEPGVETFVVGARSRPAPGLAELLAQARALPATDRSARVKALRELLERRMGPVRAIEVTHQP
ncbi:MAG: DUF4384 domain-containing protein [Candidatus Eisenbacteria bacterium]|nr:DUF4384 domain-containing protein [Candidatus Eisenbacteria bacterium]